MTVSRKRMALFLALALPGLLVAGAGWCLCTHSDDHTALEQAAQTCCPGSRTDAQREFFEAAESPGDRETSCCDSWICGACLDLPQLIGPTPATAPASDAHVLAWAQAPVFAGATLSLSLADGALSSFPGHDRSQRSAPSQLFARTISLRC